MKSHMNCTTDGCHYRHSVDGCTEWSCIYHGKENRTQTLKEQGLCPRRRDAASSELDYDPGDDDL